jgi:signal transduction histidine kinase
VLGVVLVFRDVTERQNREIVLRHKQKLEAIGTLAGGVAHEINNPLSVIINFAELILEDSRPESEIWENASYILREGKRIAEIVRSLLAFARQEKERHSPSSPGDILHDTMSLTRKILEKDQISCEIEVEEDLPKIKCRNQQIMQVLMNLITNARDALNLRYPGYSQEKTMTIRVRNLSDGGKSWIRFTIRDSGPGIPPELRRRIFDPFFTTKAKGEGTGLGLAISYGIVAEHGGRLTVDSEIGEYTAFHVDLPVDNGWSLEKEE